MLMCLLCVSWTDPPTNVIKQFCTYAHVWPLQVHVKFAHSSHPKDS